MEDRRRWIGRLTRAKDLAVGKLLDWSYAGQAMKSWEAGERIITFDWPLSTADMWVDIITSTGRWKIESTTHPQVWDSETNSNKTIVRVVFARIDVAHESDP